VLPAVAILIISRSLVFFSPSAPNCFNSLRFALRINKAVLCVGAEKTGVISPLPAVGLFFPPPLYAGGAGTL